MKLSLTLVLFIASSILPEIDSAHLKRGKRKGSGQTIVDTIEKYLREINDIVKDSSERTTSTIDLNTVLDKRRHNHVTPDVVDGKNCEEHDCENGGSDMRIYTNPSGKRAIGNGATFWPDNTIYYDFADGGNFTTSTIETITSYIEHFNSQVKCDKIKWKKLEAGDNRYHVKIINEDGCWSFVGYLGDFDPFKTEGFQYLSLQEPVGDEGHCIHRGTAQHEMMHAMGFAHEQNRADRDDYIRINTENIRSGTEGNFEKIPGVHEKALSHLQSPYDFQSLMHYSSTAFSKNQKRTIEALIKGTTDTDEATTEIIGAADDLSSEDLRELKYLYQCDASTTTTTEPTTTEVTTTEPTTTEVTTTEETKTEATTTEPPTQTTDGCGDCTVLNGLIPSGYSGFTFATESSCENEDECNAKVSLSAASTTGSYCFNFHLSSEEYWDPTETYFDFILPAFENVKFDGGLTYYGDGYYQLRLEYAGTDVTVHVAVKYSDHPVVFYDVTATSC